MFRLQSIFFKTISVLYTFTFITSTLFLNGVDGRSIITLKPQQGVDASILHSKVAPKKTIVVDVNGSENFRSIQEAIDSIPSGNQEWVVIHVKKGIYRYLITNNILFRTNSFGP